MPGEGPCPTLPFGILLVVNAYYCYYLMLERPNSLLQVAHLTVRLVAAEPGPCSGLTTVIETTSRSSVSW